jgi:hypothetical protein
LRLSKWQLANNKKDCFHVSLNGQEKKMMKPWQTPLTQSTQQAGGKE